MNRKIIFTFILAITASIVSGQFSDIYVKYSTKYPNENQIQLQSANKVVLQIENGDVVIRQHISDEFMYLRQEKKVQMNDRIYFSDFKKVENVKASVYNFDKGKYKEQKVKDFSIKDEITENFHDDQKSINFVYPGVFSGSKTAVSYDVFVENPRFFRTFFLANYFPIKNLSLEILVNNNIQVEFLLMNTDSVQLDYSKTIKGKNTLHSWHVVESPGMEYQSNSIDPRYFFPHIIPIINSYVEDGDTTKILGSTTDLYDWYQSLIVNINQEPCDENLSLLVDSLVKDKTTDYDKVKAIYYWTQKNIKYVAFEDGLGGFVPRDANEVYNKKYGDCKDNSSILNIMLKEAGLEGYLTWIGTRDIPYKYNEVHSPQVDNHMITTYIDGDDVYFLDATGRYLNLDLPSSFIQGKEALVGISPTEHKIIEVPIVGAEKNQRNIVEELNIVDNTIHGSASATYSGYEKIDFFHYLENSNTPEKFKSMLTNELGCGNNSFELDGVEETNKYSYDENYTVSYDYVVNNYIKEIGDALYVNLNLHIDEVRNLMHKEELKAPIKFTHQYQKKFSTTLIVPENYAVKSLPTNITMTNELCDIAISYEVVDNKIIYSQDLIVKFLTIGIEEQKELQKMLKRINKKYKDTVVLELIK